jgi:hypothetical protein
MIMKTTTTRRQFLRMSAGLSLAAALRPRPALAQTAQPRVQSNHITYLGFFSVPEGPPSSPFSYGGMGLAMGADGASLYYGGHVFNQTIGRISIPSIGGTATIIQNPTSISGSTGGQNETQIAGALVWNNRLIVTKRNKYSTGDFKPVTAGSLSISGFGPMQSVAGATGWYVSGYMGIIPPEWRTLLGGPCFIGNGVMSINSVCTNGPSFYSFNPDSVNAGTSIPATPLMYYPLSNPLSNPSTTNSLFSRSNYYNAGMAFPAGSRSILFFHRQGYGSPTYKKDDGCGGSSGEGAAPYRRQVTAFDANDLLAVKNGTKQPYQVQPYAYWTLPGPSSSCATFSGYVDGGYCLTFDQATRRIYGVLDQAETRRVHVWQLADLGGSPPPAPPTPPSGLRVL